MVKHNLQDEIQLIDRLRRRASTSAAGIALGIGDDCAIVRTSGRDDLLLTTDLLVEDVHFRRSTHTAADIGWKALARGLSDIAAMGGKPRFCLVSLVLPPWANRRWVDGFYTGLLALAKRSEAALIGGDLAHGPQFAADIVVGGAVPKNQALRRDGARSGDIVCVSGSLGASALGLETQRGAARKRHLRPEPRLALGAFLRTRLKATAAMDLSDGLSLDLRRLALASGLHAEIEKPPQFPGATLHQALHGGEDYELLFTIAPGTPLPRTYRGTPLTAIGVMRPGRAGTVLLNGKRLPALGYDHFRTS